MVQVRSYTRNKGRTRVRAYHRRETLHSHSKESCRAFVSRHISKHIREGMEYSRAQAAAYSEARRLGCSI